MSHYNRPLSAIERAQAAYEDMMRRQRDAAQQRQSRDRAYRRRWLVSIAAVVSIALGVVIYNGWLPETLRSSFSGDNSTKRFGATRTGQVRTMVQGNTCQELNFSNDSGSYVSGNLVACEQPIVKPSQSSSAGSRVNSIRDAFSRQ